MSSPVPFFPGFRPHPQQFVSRPETGPSTEVSLENAQPADVLITLAHPDDEVFLTGTAALLEQAGYSVQFVYVTDGDAGRDVSGRNLSGNALAESRRKETRNALRILGITRPPLFLAYPDGKVLEYANTVQETLGRVIRQVRPKLVLSFGPEGITQHADHIAVGALTDQAVKASEASEAVYHMALSPASAERFRAIFKEGLSTAWQRVQGAERPIDVKVDIGEVLSRKAEAVGSHISQFTPHEVDCFRAFYAPYAFETFSRSEVTPR